MPPVKDLAMIGSDVEDAENAAWKGQDEGL